MTPRERRDRLEKLPCVFPAVPLYFHFELLEEAREARWFTFEALEYRPSTRRRRSKVEARLLVSDEAMTDDRSLEVRRRRSCHARQHVAQAAPAARLV